MSDELWTRNELVNELNQLRQRVEKLERVRARRMEAYDRLEASARQFRTAFQNAGIAMAILAPDGRFLRVNRSFREMLGYSEHELKWMSFEDIIHPQDIPPRNVDPSHILTAASKDTQQSEKRYVHRMGYTLRIAANVTLVHDWQGRPAYFLCQLADISRLGGAETRHRKDHDQLQLSFEKQTLELQRMDERLRRELAERGHVEEELRESEERCQLLFSEVGDAILLLDAESLRIVDANQAAIDLYECSKEELLNLQAPDLTAEPEKTRAALQEQTEKGTAFGPFRWGMKKDGTVFPVEISGASFTWQGKQMLCSIIRDVSQQLRAEEQIRSALAEKETLLTEIHHRVKNNLQMVSSLLSLQCEYLEDKKTLKIFNESATRLRSMAMVHEQLCEEQDLARINMEDYVENLVADLFRLSEDVAGKVEVKTEFEGTLLRLDVAFPCALIVYELVSNALKHAFPGDREGEIQVSLLSAGNGQFELTVADNGIGLPEHLSIGGSESLGLRLVGIWAEQLLGKVTLDRTLGTKVQITFEDVH